MPRNADSIPRYEEPTFTELSEKGPFEGVCSNCAHKVSVELDGKEYQICVQERDDRRAGQFGDVEECDPELTDCYVWDWDGHGYDLR